MDLACQWQSGHAFSAAANSFAVTGRESISVLYIWLSGMLAQGQLGYAAGGCAFRPDMSGMFTRTVWHDGDF